MNRLLFAAIVAASFCGLSTDAEAQSYQCCRRYTAYSYWYSYSARTAEYVPVYTYTPGEIYYYRSWTAPTTYVRVEIPLPVEPTESLCYVRPKDWGTLLESVPGRFRLDAKYASQTTFTDEGGLDWTLFAGYQVPAKKVGLTDEALEYEFETRVVDGRKAMFATVIYPCGLRRIYKNDLP